MKRIHSVILLVALLATGCQNMRQEIEPASLGNIEKKLVIIGFISPQDSVLAIKVNITRPVADPNYTSNFGTVPNAKVFLKTGSRSIQLTYNGKQSYYQADPKKFPIRAGESYQISAETPEGLKASGSCTVPQAVRLQRIRLDSVAEGGQTKQYFVRYYWEDAAREVNYYQTHGTFQYAKPCPTCKPDAGVKPKSETAPVWFESLGQVNTLLSDQSRDGRQLESYRGFLNESKSTQTLSDKLVFSTAYDRATVLATLLTVDEAYFKYHQALELQKKADSNPFSEAVLLPTTIVGGLGCFAGYNQSSLFVTLK
ncbi:DUF4249 domain-containing protein [Larkinella sp. VNQ87]|uniref:DUF4249 domain-containing protein n=1 Tax=Larkinella sp. VNQ87 TaxID=3400921 RepID=UPI003C0D14DD